MLVLAPKAIKKCALLVKPLGFASADTVHTLYLQMKLLYDAGDQPGELVHVNRVDEGHCFFNAVWKEKSQVLMTVM